jgi:titin
LGEAVNTCNISVSSRSGLYLESQNPDGWEKIRALESHSHGSRPEEEDVPAVPPKFVTELQGTTKLAEGQTAHLECRVEPIHDPKLRVEVFHNDKPLQSASRYHVTSDFGYIALDIKHVYAQDAGKYTVRVVNDFGECSSSINVEVEDKSGLILESQRPEGLDKIRELEDTSRYRKEAYLETKTFQRPVFTAPLKNLDAVAEGANAHLECRLIPVGDPTIKVEWFRNERPLEDSSRIQKTHDFGYVALDLSYIRPEDEGIYMCRATNSLGKFRH